MSANDDPTVCPTHLVPVNRRDYAIGDRVRCHADCGMADADEVIEGTILEAHSGVMDGWYEMSGHPRFSTLLVHRQELEAVAP